jgi:hypothetical protein
VDDVQDFIDAGELSAMQFPSGPRIDVNSVKRLERALRNGYVPDLSQLPGATIRVGTWRLPSGRSLEVSVCPAERGVRRLRVLYDQAAPLSAEDRHALDERVLPDVARAIEQVIGRRGVGLIALPLPLRAGADQP